MIIADEDPDRPGDGEEDGCFDLMDDGEWDEDVDVEDESLGTSYHWNRNNQRIKATTKTTPLWFIRLSGFHIKQTNPYSMVTLLENGLGIALQSLLVLITIIGKPGKWCHASSCQWIRSCGGTSFSCFVVALSWCCTSPPLDFFRFFIHQLVGGNLYTNFVDHGEDTPTTTMGHHDPYALKIFTRFRLLYPCNR